MISGACACSAGLASRARRPRWRKSRRTPRTSRACASRRRKSRPSPEATTTIGGSCPRAGATAPLCSGRWSKRLRKTISRFFATKQTRKRRVRRAIPEPSMIPSIGIPSRFRSTRVARLLVTRLPFRTRKTPRRRRRPPARLRKTRRTGNRIKNRSARTAATRWRLWRLGSRVCYPPRARSRPRAAFGPGRRSRPSKCARGTRAGSSSGRGDRTRRRTRARSWSTWTASTCGPSRKKYIGRVDEPSVSSPFIDRVVS
mmetsp:Transcript_14441/g.60832  ORF Transcript_14441/g.60832 Transcript_14441/m.60832 type:complete len:257 (-) Transcript_14441:593-1363(-)